MLQKNLRCYNVAKLYYQVGDYESTKRYVFNYLEIRDNSASAHKLLGQAYEALGQKEAAFNEYKISLELEGRQDDLVLKSKKLTLLYLSFIVLSILYISVTFSFFLLNLLFFSMRIIG